MSPQSGETPCSALQLINCDHPERRDQPRDHFAEQCPGRATAVIAEVDAARFNLDRGLRPVALRGTGPKVELMAWGRSLTNCGEPTQHGGHGLSVGGSELQPVLNAHPPSDSAAERSG